MLRSLTTRRTAPLAVLVSAALLLSGCGGSDDKKDTDKQVDNKNVALGSCDYKPGDLSKSVKVTGEFGKEPKADFDKPLEATGLQRSVVDEGDGKETKKNDEITGLITLFIGGSGKSVYSNEAAFKVGDPNSIAAFDAAISCVPIGSRTVVTAPAKDVVGEAGNPQLGIKAGDTLVIVTDVIGIKKPLKPAAWTDAPEVTFNSKGVPKVTLTGKPDPALRLKVLKKGTGAVVKAGDNVTVFYQGTSWNKKNIFDQNFGKQPISFTTDGVVQGFGAALVGQKVGSRVIVTIPPKYGYGEGEIGSGNLVGETLVFVIQIEKTEAAAAAQ